MARLSSLSAAELESRVGKLVATQELGGTLLVAEFVSANYDEAGRLRSIDVLEGESRITWPTQWYRAVFMN